MTAKKSKNLRMKKNEGALLFTQTKKWIILAKNNRSSSRSRSRSVAAYVSVRPSIFFGLQSESEQLLKDGVRG